MGASIDGGWFEEADTPRERPERADAPKWSFELPPPRDDDVPALEDKDVCDPSSDFQIEVYPDDQSPLSESERQSITDSVSGLVEFAKRRILSLAADGVLPVFGGRFVDLGFEILDVATSIRALGSDDPVLEAPLPSPVPGLGFTLEIPLASGEDGHAAPPLALCVAPDSPSLTGGWALDAAEHDDQQAQEQSSDACEAVLERLYSQRDLASRPTAPVETSQADPPTPRIRRRPAIACLVEADLDSLRLPRRRKPRAWVLAILAAEYTSRFRENPDLRRFELFVIADKGRRCGLWIWLDADSEIDRLFFS